MGDLSDLDRNLLVDVSIIKILLLNRVKHAMYPLEEWLVRGTELIVVCCLDDVNANFAPDCLDLDALFKMWLELLESCAIGQLTEWCGGADRPVQQVGLTSLRLAEHE